MHGWYNIYLQVRSLCWEGGDASHFNVENSWCHLRAAFFHFYPSMYFLKSINNIWFDSDWAKTNIFKTQTFSVTVSAVEISMQLRYQRKQMELFCMLPISWLKEGSFIASLLTILNRKELKHFTVSQGAQRESNIWGMLRTPGVKEDFRCFLLNGFHWLLKAKVQFFTTWTSYLANITSIYSPRQVGSHLGPFRSSLYWVSIRFYLYSGSDGANKFAACNKELSASKLLKPASPHFVLGHAS